MTLDQKANKILKIKKNVTKEYKEMSRLKKEIIEEMSNLDIKDLELSKGLHAIVVSNYEKQIDYDKLFNTYPDIYVLGLRTTFSKKQALNSISSKVLSNVLKDCIKKENDYDIKFKRRK